MMTGQAELEIFLDRKASEFSELMAELLRALAGKGGSAIATAEERLADLIREQLIVADLQGRRRMLREADVARVHLGRFVEESEAIPTAHGLTFKEAVSDIITRDPRVVPSSVPRGERYRWVQRLYSREHAFAAARSASEKLTRRVQDAVRGIVTSGRAASLTENEIMKIAAEESHQWSRSYASVVYRTNVSTAYTNGRIQQARDEDVREVIGALEVVGIEDANERPNHAAFRGLIAAVDDPIWKKAKPPYGYQCRHGLASVSRDRLASMGLIDKEGNVTARYPANFVRARYDEGFTAGVF